MKRRSTYAMATEHPFRQSKPKTIVPSQLFVALNDPHPFDLAEPELQPVLSRAEQGARASGTPFVSFYTPQEIVQEGLDVGFKSAHHVSSAVLAERYFAERTDGLRPPLNAEELLVAST